MRFRRTSASLSFLFLFAGCGGCPGAAVCGVGERDVDGVCAAVDRLYVNIDERRDVRDDTSRNGIGINACTFRGDSPQAERTEGACALIRYNGTSSATAFTGEAGALRIGLAEEPVLMLPDPESHCYQSDLFPTRRDLFAPGDELRVEATGGNNAGPFDVTVPAPETLLLEPPGAVERGADLMFAWIGGSADQLYVLAHSHDEATNESVDIQCDFTDGDGSAALPATFVDALVGDEVNLYFLRQNWAHAEPDESDMAVDVFASSSVIRTLALPPQ